MKCADVFLFALKDIRRSFSLRILPAIAAAVSVAALSLVSCLVDAAGSYVSGKVDGLGLRGVAVIAKKGGFGREETELLAALPGVERVMPLSVDYGSLTANGQSEACILWGVNEMAGELIACELLYGRYPTAGEAASGAAVAVIEERTALEAFGRANAVGQTVSVSFGGRKTELTVVGVAREQGDGLLDAATLGIPKMVYLPVELRQRLCGKTAVGQLAIGVRDEKSIDNIRNNIIYTISRSTQKPAENFTVEDISGYKGILLSLIRSAAALLDAIAAISVPVAGCCILSAAVTLCRQSRREIGTMMALGAKRRDVAAVYTLEASLTALMGGVPGAALGVAAALIISVKAGLGGMAGMIVKGLLLTAICGAAGALFGLGPALKAAKLDPAEALRE